ncbi:hypothetical protein [Rhodosalinus sp. K401]|uniref:hypothetical protein n=1 Tax=Rhodosalinus sp. K401 TaxID=3239195 RepID=UPI003524B078
MRGFGIWLVAVALVILAGIVVPYGILSGGAPSLVIFVFWCVFGAAVIGLIAAGVARWKI